MYVTVTQLYVRVTQLFWSVRESTYFRCVIDYKSLFILFINLKIKFIMSLIYKPVKMAIKNKTGEQMWHINLVKFPQVIETVQLAEEVSEKSSLTVGDAQSAIRNLMSVMRSHLLNSYSVRLEGLGTFTVIARTRGKGVATKKEVGPHQISSLRCQFTPEYFRPAAMGTTRALLQGVKFTHIDELNKLDGTGSGNSGEGDGGEVIDPME